MTGVSSAPPTSVSFADLSPSRRMYCPMTVHAEGDQIVEGVVSEVALRTDVMDLPIRRTATPLAPPSVPHENLSAQLCIGHSVQPTARASLLKHAHASLRRRDENVGYRIKWVCL